MLASQASACDAANLQEIAHQYGMTRRFSIKRIRHFLRCAGFKYRVASGGIQKTTGSKRVDSHVDKLRLRLMYSVTEYEMHLFLHHQHGRFLDLEQRGWARPKQDGRVGFVGAADKRNLTISTVVTVTCHHHGPTHCGGRHETSGAGFARAREDFLQLQREPLVHREHLPGADRMAWRLGATTRVLAVGAAVGLCLCPPEGFSNGMGPCCSSRVPVLFVPAGYTAELQLAGISIQQRLKHSIKRQTMQFFAESVCRDEAVLDPRLSTMKCSMALQPLRRGGENRNVTTKAWDQACGESRSREPQWPTLR